MRQTLTRPADERINWATSTPFILFHLVPLLAVFTGVTLTAVAIFVVFYGARMFAITAGYHRYFAHRSYKVNRPVQFVLALAGTSALQKGPLWWAGHHRAHHRYADAEGDIHSPQNGFWWSHVGWILCDKYSGTDLDAVEDLAVYPELRFLDKYDAIGPWLLGITAFLVGGWSGLVFGFFGSTVLLWHATFTVNSLNHTIGTRRYATADTSRNNAALALLTLGEGWHNNHHHFPTSARQGFFWWEVDITWYGLRALSLTRLVSGLRRPPVSALDRNRVADGAFDLGMFRAAWQKAASAVSRSLPDQETVQAKQAALRQGIATSLHAAEDLAKATRRSRLPH